MNGRDIQAIALEVIDTALSASDVEAAVEAVRADLEVHDRETVVRVASAIVAELAMVITPAADRARLRDRAQRRRLIVMVGEL